MEKFPFSNEGFQQLQKKLYQLPDYLLEIQANLISANFKKWMIENFILSQDQVAFISSQSHRMIIFLATQTSIALSNRLPITLNKPVEKIQKQLLDSKLIRPESNFTALFGAGSKTEICGNLVIHISYKQKNYPKTTSNVSQKYNQPFINQLF